MIAEPFLLLCLRYVSKKQEAPRWMINPLSIICIINLCMESYLSYFSQGLH